MGRNVEIQYGVVFGKGDASDWITWDLWLDDEAEKEYLRALKLRLPLDSIEVLNNALSEAYEEIEEQEIEYGIEYEDEYVLECTGRGKVDPDEINDLVADRDEHTLEFFGLTELDAQELDEWDANDLDELPEIREFQEDFEESSPFDEGWILNIEFVEHPEEDDLSEDEAKETLNELFMSANGDNSTVKDYVDRCKDLCGNFKDGYFDLEKIANEIAKVLGVEGWK